MIVRYQRKIKRDNAIQMKKSALRKLKFYQAQRVVYDAKVCAIMDDFKKEWMREVNIHVPRWAQVLSLWFPPKVYSRVFFTLWPRECFQKIQNDIAKKPWPAWRKAFNKFAVVAIFNSVKFVFHDWLLYCFRFPLRTWGTKRVIYSEDHEQVTMDIYLWGELVYSKTRKIEL